MRTYRVIVRGQFDQLTDTAKEQLRGEAESHDIFDTAFTVDGTLTYERDLRAFSLRYLVEIDDDRPDQALSGAQDTAQLQAEEFLQSAGYGFKALRVSATSVDDMLANTRRLQP